MILVLAYHSISNEPYRYATTADVFEKQLRWLKRRYRFADIAELATIIKQPQAPSEHIAHVTFDDGLQDNVINGLPVLQKLGIPGTIFVPTSLVGTVITNPGTGIKFPVLTWDEMREAEKSGLIRCESHTHTHPLLTSVDATTVNNELETSKQLLQSELNRNIIALAYPKGNFDASVAEAAAHHYSIAFGPNGTVTHWPASALMIPRVIVSSDLPMWKFKALSYAFYWQLRKLKYAATV